MRSQLYMLVEAYTSLRECNESPDSLVGHNTRSQAVQGLCTGTSSSASGTQALLALPLALPAACSLLGRLQTVEGLTPGRQHGTVAIGMRELS